MLSGDIILLNWHLLGKTMGDNSQTVGRSDGFGRVHARSSHLFFRGSLTSFFRP